MKKLHVVLLVTVAIGVGVLIAMTGDYSTYANFLQAAEKPGKSVSVVGYLVKEAEIYYDPQKNPNFFSFTMVDKEGNQHKVEYKGSKPQDFERSEQLVVKGKVDGSVFLASEISMKCPSKYVNDDIILEEGGEVTIKAQE